MENSGTGIVQSLERALNIMDILSTCPEGLSIKDLSNETGLHKSTIHRLLQTLRSKNYVYQDHRTERYHLGAKILEMSANMLEGSDIRSIAKPVLENLCMNIHETVHLSILDGSNAVYIDKLDDPNRVLRMYSQIGKRIPVFCSAVGKALVAWLDKRELQKVLDGIQYEQKTQFTVMDHESFLAELNHVRNCGYAIDWAEHEEDIFCVAAPVFDREKRVVAAISTATIRWGLSVELFCEMRRQVWQAAKQVSKYLGCGCYPIVFVPDENEIARINDLHQ